MNQMTERVENRPISEREAAVVDWLLVNGTLEGSFEHLRETVGRLRVVGRCTCGCASVDFVQDGQAGAASPIAEALAHDSFGREHGVILWGAGGEISGLEVYEGAAGSANELPEVRTLRLWASAPTPRP